MRRFNQGHWRHLVLLGILLWLGCHSLWSPFLGDNPACQTDPATCTPPSDIGIGDGGIANDMMVGNDGGTVSDMMALEVRPNLVMVLMGTFTMGSPAAEAGRASDEVQHTVRLTTNFWIAESEVTQKQYRNLMGSNPSNFVGDDLPVETVNWFEAVAYCNALSLKENLTPCYQISGTTVAWPSGVKCTGYRLPTEAEWEYAANPASLPRTVYAGSNTVDGVAWYELNAGNTTHAVKTKTANGRGLYDLSGNTWEWVWDYYQANYEALPPTDPIGPATGTNRIVRGGSWFLGATEDRVARRYGISPAVRGNVMGIRVVKSSL